MNFDYLTDDRRWSFKMNPVKRFFKCLIGLHAWLIWPGIAPATSTFEKRCLYCKKKHKCHFSQHNWEVDKKATIATMDWATWDLGQIQPVCLYCKDCGVGFRGNAERIA